jgi:hypothetical protein
VFVFVCVCVVPLLPPLPVLLLRLLLLLCCFLPSALSNVLSRRVRDSPIPLAKITQLQNDPNLETQLKCGFWRA